MGIQFIQQPNGLWAQYSTCSDQFIALDMTEEELIQDAGLEAKAKGEDDARAYIQKRKEDRLNQFSVDWKEAVEKTLRNIDPDEADFIALMQSIDKFQPKENRL